MKVKTQRPKDDPEQSKRFIEAARAAEADESEDGARDAFRRATGTGPKRKPAKT
jgi:hypothetical protein